MDRYHFDPKQLDLIERSPIPQCIFQYKRGKFVTLGVSEGFCRLMGIPRETVYGALDESPFRNVHPDDVARVSEDAARFAKEGGEFNVLYRSLSAGKSRMIRAYGEMMETGSRDRVAVIWFSDQGPYAENLDEVPDRLNETLSRALQWNSLVQKNYYDPLTGLPSMTYFFSLAESGQERMYLEGKSPVMVFFDITGMKFFNQLHGYEAGDQLIVGLAKILIGHFSVENCSRFGQDHFAVYTDEPGLEETLKEIFREFSALNRDSSLSLRVGIYQSSLGHVSVGTACDRAKMACDTAKGVYVSGFRYFDREMLRRAEERLYITSHLDQAMAEGWIQVYYQPIVRAANGRVCDEEALSRWIDPERGMLSPGEFIPVLERARLIDKLDLYVLERVLEKMKEQQARGYYLVPQSLNLSRVDFETCDIVEEVCLRVDRAGIPRDKITIEITESTVGSDLEFIKTQVTRFQELGFPVWMDDFGSGYSSLDVLQAIHFDLIKFDMRFMQRFQEGEEAKIILTELIKMAIALGIDTVAEGVETQEQVEFLREVGCTKLQGFFYCRPIPMEGIIQRYDTGVQIGFENPDETDYYATLGKINLYDISVVGQGYGEELGTFFDTLPMAVIENSKSGIRIVRCNKSYREFMVRAFGGIEVSRNVPYRELMGGAGEPFARAVDKSLATDEPLFINEGLPGGAEIHAMLRKVAVNPVTGTVALVAVVLGITKG